LYISPSNFLWNRASRRAGGTWAVNGLFIWHRRASRTGALALQIAENPAERQFGVAPAARR
jgi:hypothetical protein